MTGMNSGKIVLYEGVSLWMACTAYLLPLEKKRNPNVRIFWSAVLGIGLSVLLAAGCCFWLRMGYGTGDLWHLPVWDYFCAVAITALCIEYQGAAVWYCGIWASMTNMCVLEGSRILLQKWSYWEEHWQWYLLQLLFAAAVDTVISLTAARWMPKDGRYQIGPRQMILACLVYMAFGCLFLYAVSQKKHLEMIYMLQFYCIHLLYLQNTLFRKSSMQKELDMIQLLLWQQKEQYQISKETIDLINHKCHDLKHQVHAIRAVKGEAEREAYLKEIEDSVQIYDSIVHTGNEILDVILTEKSLFCKKYGIRISCVADGRLLSFMDPVDLYALLGNALDNAIEALKKISREKERAIDIMLYEKRSFLLLQIINPVEWEVNFKDGLPVSTKEENGYHGFGVKSMQHLAQKYGGFMTTEVKDGCFYLIIVMPLHSRDKEKQPFIQENRPFIQNELNL